MNSCNVCDEKTDNKHISKRGNVYYFCKECEREVPDECAGLIS